MPSSNERLHVGGSEMDVYVSLPEGRGPFPGVVAIHHAPGVDQFMREVCDRLAGDGYAAVAPDLFHRITEGMLAGGATKRDHLSDPDIVADVNATVDYLLNHTSVTGERLGITGFCMGGRIVWLAAATNPHFKAAVPYYGGNIMVPWGNATRSPFQLTSRVSCPIMFHFGEMDANPSLADRDKLEAELTRLGKTHRFFTYPGADHAFMNHTGPRYHKEAAETSWPRTLEFFSQHLKGVRAG